MKLSILTLVLILLHIISGCDYKSKDLPREKRLELAEKCSKAGKEYYDEYMKYKAPKGVLWGEPEYHYSSSLNTCLIHIRYVLPSTKISFQYNQVIDIFSNKVILYGWFTRDVEKNTETLTKTDIDGIPNFTSIEYFKRKDELFKD